MSQPSYRRLSRIRHNGSSGGDVSIRRRRRFHNLVPITALTCLTIHESTSLIIPTQNHLTHHTSLSTLTGFQYLSSSYQYKRRRRDVSNTIDNDVRSIFQLYFAPWDSCNNAHFVHCENYNINFERDERQMAKRRDYNIMTAPTSSASLRSVRCSTSLCMAKESESNNDGKNEDKKKKEKTSNSKNNKRKDGSSAGISKGSNKQSKQQQQQRTRRKKSGKKKQQQNRSKGKSKSNRSKSTIKTSGENTSLKGFKSEQQSPVTSKEEDSKNSKPKEGADNEASLQKRVIQLESIVSNQMTEIQKLRREIDDLTKSTAVFANVVNILQEAGLRIDEDDNVALGTDGEHDESVKRPDTLSTSSNISSDQVPFQTMDDMEIFGIAPKSVTDAADAAGSSILSAILAGKHRMLVDVRDAELTRDPKLFVEFIELAILPVAAGLEGLDTSADENEYVTRNRVKIVFPTVKELMSYRRSMALAAPEVVSLSTLGFDPVDEKDNLIVVVAPSPDDMAGVTAMEKLMARTRRGYNEPGQSRLTQPVVVVNHHMVPINMDEFGRFTSVYHLRLLSVQYMTGDSAPDYVAKNKASKSVDENLEDTRVLPIEATKQEDPAKDDSEETSKDVESSKTSEDDEALEAAMTHAHEIGVHQGVTRAMVIRAYPKPWHVFVDTSPDTDADFEVAATFDIEPTQEDVNYAIVECLEGSEREDEIVAQQMQAALESGQLNRVSDMLGISPTDIVAEDKTATASSVEDTAEVDTWVSFQEETKRDSGKDKDDNSPQQYNDWDDLYFFDDDDWFNEDSV